MPARFWMIRFTFFSMIIFDNTEKDWDYLKGPSKFNKMDNPITMMALDMEAPRAKVKREKLWSSAKNRGLF